MATVADIAQEMADEFGEEYTDDDVKNQFVIWVTETIEEIVTSGRWFFQNSSEDVTLVAGVKDYSLSSAVSEVRDIRSPGTKKRIAYIPVERLIARAKDLSLAGTPTNWYIDSLGASNEMKISLWPVPNAAAVTAESPIKVYTIKRPATLTETSTIPMPEEYIRVLRDGVRAKVKFNDGQLEAANWARSVFKEGLQLLNARFAPRPRRGSDMPVKQKIKQQAQSPSSPDGIA
jgi:hypothetical protein